MFGQISGFAEGPFFLPIAIVKAAIFFTVSILNLDLTFLSSYIKFMMFFLTTFNC